MAVDPAAKLARTIADMDRRLQAVERGAQLGLSSVQIGGDTVTVKDSIRAAVTASQNAAEAIARASSAEAKADGVVNTYYTDNGTPPSEKPGTGDFWFRRDTKDLAMWDGDSWEPVTSAAVKAAVAAADTAAAAADGKISTWFRANNSPPPSPGEGDIWFVTDQQNRQRLYRGGKWVDVRDGGIQDALDAASDAASLAAGANQSALVALSSANGKTKVVYATSDPGSTRGVNVGDTWFTHNGSGYVLRQWRWNGSSWESMILSNATVTSLDAGRITTGTLAAGVSIIAGVPGSTRTELSSAGLRGYVGNDLRFSIGGSSLSVVADLFQSSGIRNGRTQWIEIGQADSDSSSDEIRLLRANNANVTLSNTGSGNTGALTIGLKVNRNNLSGNWTLDSSAIRYSGSIMNLINNSGASFGLAAYNAAVNVFNGQFAVNSQSIYHYAANQATTALANGGGLVVVGAPNGAYGNTLLRSAYYGGGTIKLTSDGAVQVRTYNDDGYSYLRGIMQDQSSPDLKENIQEWDGDALAELGGMKRYTFDWKRDPLVPFAPPPPDSSSGILLSEVPNSVQKTDDGYAIGSLVGLVIAAQNQENTERKADVAELRAELNRLKETLSV